MSMRAIFLFIFCLAAAAFAANTPPTTGPLTSVAVAVNNLCFSLTQLLPVASMLMIVIAGVIYAAGQVMGAETRARANVWATAALVGALIGILIFAIAPTVLQTIYGTTEGGYKIDCSTEW